jgi:uncharacterized protein YfaS (alpha-2-macroglobulin family)
MRGLIGSGTAFVVAALLAFSAAPIHAADRSISLSKGTDLPGFDYATEKGVTLKACEAACLDDNLCRAFTFNEKAGWCFLKSAAGEQSPFKGATSGIVTQHPTSTEIEAARVEDIPFPAQDIVDNARNFAVGLPKSDPAPKDVSYSDLVTAGDEAASKANPAAAIVSWRQALGIVANDSGLWLKLSKAQLDRAASEVANGNSSAAYDFASVGSWAAVNGLLRTEDTAERADALALFGKSLEYREMWREAIATWRASLKLVDDATRSASLEQLVAERGFRVVDNSVDSEAAIPRICAIFSETLPGGDTDLSSYVTVADDNRVAVDVSDSQLCVTGVAFGKRYQLKLRAGLPSASGETLRTDVDLALYVPDRTPFVGFANTAYVMPSGLGGGLPITSVNAKTADVVIYRIGDRNIANAVRSGIFQSTLDGYSAQDVADRYGEMGWEGKVDLAQGAPNVMVTTAIPVGEVVKSLSPGVYVITAKVENANDEYWQSMATQWFIVSDLGLTTIAGDDGVHMFVRSLQTAQPMSGVKVKLVAVNNEILGESTTDIHGEAVFAPGLARGEGGRAAQLVTAETENGDYAFLDVTKPAFDLTDRGVAGRQAPGPLDLYATTERGVYRPTETVFLTAVLRDPKAAAVTGLPMTLEIERPDGVVATHEVLPDAGAGGYFAAVPLPAEAMRGSWTARFYADPKDSALTSISFLVEDFEPERLAFDVTAPDAALIADEATEVSVAAMYLYGATAPGLAIEADSVVKAVASLPELPGYTFGRTDDAFETARESLGVVGITDESGNAAVEIAVPMPGSTTRLLEAQVVLNLIDSNGRPVQRSFTRALVSDGDRIGIKPEFSDAAGLEEGSAAAFDIVTVNAEGKQVAREGLTWRLSRIDTTYQWYRDNGAWKWEAVSSTAEVANGTLDTLDSGPAKIAANIEWGRYQLEVDSTGDSPTSSSYEFYAGYYYPDAGSETPDTLSVALDKEAYRLGDTVHLKLEPQFAGTALVMVVDNRVIDMKAVEVPTEGTTVDLTVTEQWGPGAYVTAVLYRPADAKEKRMPARALGLAFADVDPGPLKLGVTLDAPKEALPRKSFTTAVKLDNVAEGDTAFVAVAAVDLGILNLTRFPVPDPDGYFFGQRQLGMEFRDLYGQLIDPTQGLAGAMRSGGDEAGSRLGTPPATTVLVALHSGVVKVGADGTATVTFDMPDFNGTVRLMAMAWSSKAVGHASADIVVRDPVVVNLTPPRFLRVDDSSRLLVEINNLSGPAGAYKVTLSPEDGIATTQPTSEVSLEAGDRATLNLDLTGKLIGDVPLTLTITGPTGDALVKSLTLGVRATSAPATKSEFITLKPGDTLDIGQNRFGDIIPMTGDLTLAVGPVARLDVPQLLLALDRYPYGCAEQVTSRAMPLLYLNDVARMLNLGTDDAIEARIQGAIADLLAKQNSNGSFGLWGPFSDTTLWLDAYVTEFLLRAKDKGYAVPELALSMALDNLSNQLSATSDFSEGGEDIAYALYDLALAGKAAIGDLRYYLEAKLDAFSTPLAKAQLGAALALYGDRTRAADAFNAAIADLATLENRGDWRGDYGSRLRDSAAVLALAAETKPVGVDLSALTKLVADQRDLARWTNTQEDAWTLMAAAALGTSATDGKVTLNGEAVTGAVYRRYHDEDISAPVKLANTGNTPVEVKVTTTAIPVTPPAASSDGFTISRQFFLPDGTPADLSSVQQNDRFVVVITATPTTLGSGQYVIADAVPGGFEIENSDLSAGGGVGDMSWLSLTSPAHVEARTDQYVAAFRYLSDVQAFTTAYLVRAVSPGSFALPGATVEDMYRPEYRANTEAGRISIDPTGP